MKTFKLFSLIALLAVFAVLGNAQTATSYDFGILNAAGSAWLLYNPTATNNQEGSASSNQ